MQYPYIKDHGIEGLQFKFNTPEATAWYDPLKPYTLLEYQWVRENLDLENQVVVDAGAHHGNYAVVFKGAYYIVCFEMVPMYCRFCFDNLQLNGIEASAVNCVTLAPDIASRSMMDHMPDIYKMDIEGDEFSVLPVELEQNPQVHTWIVEVHPDHGNPDFIASLFDEGFELLKVDREKMVIRPYAIGEKWPTHSTLIARKE